MDTQVGTWWVFSYLAPLGRVGELPWQGSAGAGRRATCNNDVLYVNVMFYMGIDRDINRGIDRDIHKGMTMALTRN